MKSNYKTLGEHIRLVDERNKGLRVTQLLGLSISKQFIPSVANIIGTDMENYKIIRKNQFACSTMQVRRDKKMPVALLQEVDEAIISQAYPIFEVKNEKELLPEYLMMWFTRSEFDREACFHAVGGVRGSLEWEDFENLQLPIPPPDKQKEIVKEYNVIQNRIALNQQLIQKLEETAQAIYREWFVDFEFPNVTSSGVEMPYKSSGGEMVWCEELGKEIPLGWENERLSSIINIKDGTHNSPSPTENGYPLVTSTHLNLYDIKLTETYNISEEDFIQTNKRSKVYKYDILFSMIGTVGLVNYVLYDEVNFAIKNVGLFKTSERKEIAEYILFYLKSDYMKLYLASNPNGSTQNYVTLGFLRDMPILVPSDKTILKFEEISKKVIETIHLKTKENQKLTELKEFLLSRLATVE
ncbi:restriction endonuclease subunit S [Lacihabitans lacunae]|uniref:Restriction endonuclease subunit S n=1 Tax=Lacihabitans lacunae TaxID=1028214 RepID=A0ABV7Z149_9BACT